jgi:hypothetical protein
MVPIEQLSLIGSHKWDGVNRDIAKNHRKGISKLFVYMV